MKTFVIYLTGVGLGIALVVGFFYLSPTNSQADLSMANQISLAKTTNKAIIDQEISESRQNGITRAVKLTAPAVVGINVISLREYRYRSPFYSDPFFRQFFPDKVYREKVENLGSGFIISEDGYILTNDHVVHDALKIVVTMTSGKKFDADIVGFDFINDIALLKIDAVDLPYIPFGKTGDVIIGEWAIAIGNPFGLFSIHAQPTVTVGVISAVDRDFEMNREQRHYRDMIQTDASINRGNSGGPLVNSLGQLIGMNTMIFSEGGGSIGLGFAIPANKLNDLYKSLKERGGIERDFWTGMNVQDVNRLVAVTLRLPELRGVVITDVERNSPTDKAGIEAPDVILAINDQPVNNTRDVENIMRINDFRVGDVLQFTIFRAGKVSKVDLKLEKRR